MCPSRNVSHFNWMTVTWAPLTIRTTLTTLTDQGSIIKIIAEFALFTWSSSLWFWWRWKWLHCFVIINDRVTMNAATHSDFCLRVAISWVVFNTHRKVLGFGNAWLEQVTWNKSCFWYHLVVCTLFVWLATKHKQIFFKLFSHRHWRLHFWLGGNVTRKSQQNLTLLTCFLDKLCWEANTFWI